MSRRVVSVCRRPRRLAFTLALALVCLLATNAIVVMVAARDCTMRGPGGMVAWKHEHGSFQCANCFGAGVASGTERRQWKEYDRERKLLNAFVEEMRDGAQVVLRDSSRDISILLRSDLCGLRTGNEQNFRQLYGGTFMSVVDCTA